MLRGMTHSTISERKCDAPVRAECGRNAVALPSGTPGADALARTDLAPDALVRELAERGYATRRLLSAATCRALAALYDDEARFRKRVVMERHAYGRGEYK